MGRWKRWVPVPYLIAASVVFSLVLIKRGRTPRNRSLLLGLAVIGTGLSFVGFESPQPEANTLALAKTFKVPARFCVGQGGQLALQLGIEHLPRRAGCPGPKKADGMTWTRTGLAPTVAP